MIVLRFQSRMLVVQEDKCDVGVLRRRGGCIPGKLCLFICAVHVLHVLQANKEEMMRNGTRKVKEFQAG